MKKVAIADLRFSVEESGVSIRFSYSQENDLLGREGTEVVEGATTEASTSECLSTSGTAAPSANRVENRVEIGQIVEWSIQGVWPPAESSVVELSNDDPLLLEYGPWSAIYCHSPLPDPHRFFLEFSRLVNEEMDIPRPATHYLNMPEGWRGWLPLVYSRSYLLTRGPVDLMTRAVDLLERQAVEHMVLDDSEQAERVKARSVLRIDASWFVSTEQFR
jgi:hypothetical protein